MNREIKEHGALTKLSLERRKFGFTEKNMFRSNFSDKDSCRIGSGTSTIVALVMVALENFNLNSRTCAIVAYSENILLSKFINNIILGQKCRGISHTLITTKAKAILKADSHFH